jgi:hypothetical protein
MKKFPQMLMPIYRHRFRVANCSPTITANTESVRFNFAQKTITLILRETVEGLFDDAVTLAGVTQLDIDATDSAQITLYTLKLNGLKLVDHDFTFDYASGDPAVHTFVWSYGSFITGHPAPDDLMKEYGAVA